METAENLLEDMEIIKDNTIEWLREHLHRGFLPDGESIIEFMGSNCMVRVYPCVQENERPRPDVEAIFDTLDDNENKNIESRYVLR